ncbi:hypothetical protein PV325_001377 [Microctonus aethiopoides]|uniref:Piwi-like protein 1 n=1 Tax=Microctonus aethiopoides TaxID=144406 RepID=A0AA39FAV4_9HYME|nr:hypothetical protein PV325_001377 [Microctonus aethiopoides]KAK0093311.1 hypothetical protein PV326_013844 [Microctonus aethiopoides]KAK0166158.1 hypothetical protein PV328_004605 [Microctonus aethiopoides]
MTDPGKGRGGGRGSALLAMIKKQMDTDGVGESTSQSALQESQRPADSSLLRSRGRASLIKIGENIPGAQPGAQTPETPSTSGQVSSRVGLGRASLLKMSQKLGAPGRDPEPVQSPRITSPPTPTAPVVAQIARPKMSGDGLGVTGSLSAMSLDKKSLTSGSSGPISRMGKSGDSINIMSNYINVKISPEKGIFRYEVKFSPETDSPRIRNALLNQHSNILGKAKNFDGVLLYLPIKLPEDPTILKSLRQDGTEITIKIIYQTQQKPSNSVQFFNILLNKILRLLEMVRINRNYYNPRCAHRVEQHRMELWPGYITAIEEMEDGLKLNIDASHRLMRTDTLRDFIKDIHTKNARNFRDVVLKELMGMTVLTRYNNQTYRVDGIEWDKNPTFQFDYKGKMTSIADYFNQHWNLQIKDLQQPLILHRAKKRLPQGGTKEEETLLVPELCYLTGMSDTIRSNFRIMRDLAQVTQVQPEQRRQVLQKFIQDVKNTPVAIQLLNEWGVQFEDDLVKLTGRVLPAEEIFFGNEKCIKTNEKADWSAAATRSPLLRTPNMRHWCIVYVQRDEKIISEFIRQLNAVSKTMSMRVGEALKIPLQNDTPQQYVTEIRKVINPQLEMVVAVCPTNRNDRYSAIKKLCCVDSPVRSQVILSKTISQENKLKSVTEKIALQMNCKLGGALWALKVPFNDVMIVGIDVHHAGTGGSPHGSVAGFVASMDKPLTSWYSKVCFQRPGQEIIDLLKICFVSALSLFKKKRGQYPERIIVYRDGVGDGQLSSVAQYEVEQLKSAFPLVDPTYAPKLCVIVVQKRINTRIMAMRGNRLDNPPPGTVVDSCVTRRNWYDFFLVPQTARQGTITPTHYVVLIDEANFDTDHIQRLSYKLCHLYYNWPGTIRVPAPCQYAHKLAFLVGQSIQAEPNECLAESLYYL